MHSPDEDNHKPKYSSEQIDWIRNVYLAGILFWVILIIGIGLFPANNVIEVLILIIPVIIFLVAWKSVPHISNEVERFMFQANILTLGLIIALPILTWVYKKSKQNKTIFLSLIGTAIIFSILALLDVWVPHKFLPVIHHIKSVLRTYALILFIFALYRYLIERKNRDGSKYKNLTSHKI